MSQSAPPIKPTQPKSATDTPSLDAAEARSIKRSNAKKDKLAAKRALMATRPKPSEGLPLLLYGIKRFWQLFLGLFKKDWEFVNPKMTRHDQAKNDVEVLGAKLNRISMSLVEFVLTVVNSKGGVGKTPLLAYLTMVYAHYSNNPTVALDLNQNEGTLHRMFGLLRSQTLTLSEALRRRKELTTWKAIAPLMAAHEQTGVRLLASEDIDLDVTDVSEFDELIDGMSSASHLVGIDTGNGKGYAASRSAVGKSNALVYATLWENREDAFEGIASTITGYLTRGMIDQVYKRSYMVVSGTPRNMTKQQVYDTFVDYIFGIWGLLEKGITEERRMELLTDAKAQAERKEKLMKWLGIRFDRFYIVPASRYIKTTRKADVRSSVIGLETLRAYLQILVDIYTYSTTPDHQTPIAPAAVQAELAGLEETFLAWKAERSASRKGKAQPIEDLDPLGDLEHTILAHNTGRSSS